MFDINLTHESDSELTLVCRAVTDMEDIDIVIEVRGFHVKEEPGHNSVSFTCNASQFKEYGDISNPKAAIDVATWSYTTAEEKYPSSSHFLQLSQVTLILVFFSIVNVL